MGLEFTLETRDEVGIARLSGSLTLGPQLARFARHISTFIAARNLTGLVLDMAGIEMIDSAGLGELVILYTSCGQSGCRLCLLAARAQVRNLLQITRLSDLFPQFEDELSARDWVAIPKAPGQSTDDR